MIKIWKLESGEEMKTLKGHSGSVYSVAFHNNKNILVSGSGDATIRIWDLDTGMAI